MQFLPYILTYLLFGTAHALPVTGESSLVKLNKGGKAPDTWWSVNQKTKTKRSDELRWWHANSEKEARPVAEEDLPLKVKRQESASSPEPPAHTRGPGWWALNSKQKSKKSEPSPDTWWIENEETKPAKRGDNSLIWRFKNSEKPDLPAIGEDSLESRDVGEDARNVLLPLKLKAKSKRGVDSSDISWVANEGTEPAKRDNRFLIWWFKNSENTQVKRQVNPPAWCPQTPESNQAKRCWFPWT